MKINIYNDKITIENCTPELLSILNSTLSYKDSSKEFELRRLVQRNPAYRYTAHYKKIESQSYGNLLKNVNSIVEFSSGFAYLLKDYEYIDHRHETGVDISLPWVTTAPVLREYQIESIEALSSNWRGLMNAAMGLGKTLTSIALIRQTKKRALIVCPSQAIADNFLQELTKYFGSHKVGLFGGGKKQLKDITVGIAASVTNHTEKFIEHDLGMVIFDECHRSAAETVTYISDQLKNVGRMYGLTATDYRSDGKDILITAAVGPAVIRRDITWGIDNKWLATPIFLIKNVYTNGGNYPNDKLKNYKDHVLNSKIFNEQLISDINKFLLSGKKVLVLVDLVAHGEMIAKAVGLPFACGSDKNSNSYIQQLNDGKIQGLVGTDSKIGEGCDTRLVDVLILANFPASKGPLMQNIGRGLRLYPGKNSVIILDYKLINNSMLRRHCEKRIKFYKEITSNVSDR